MKKFLPLFLFVALGLTVQAQTPTITLNVEVDGNERNLIFSATEEGHTLQIDWGNGELVETEEMKTTAEDGWTDYTTVTGTPVGDGTIKIYGDGISSFECSSRVDGAQVTAIDVTNATQLTELAVNTNKIASLDLSKNTLLKKLICYNNPITALDLTANTQLTSLEANDLQLTEINLTANKALTSLKMNNNQLTDIDLSQNTELTQAYLVGNQLTDIDLSDNDKMTYVSLNNNLFTSIDVSGCDALKTLFCTGNNITELKTNDAITSVNCTNNLFTLATLPALGCKTFTYAPQKEMTIPETIQVGETLDLSEQNNITGFAEEPQATVYTWITTDNDTLKAGTDYTEENGVFTFLKGQTAAVYCTMTSEAFPKFTGSNVFKTTEINIQGGAGIAAIQTTTPVIRGDKGMITVSNLPDGNSVEVYDLSGRKIAAKASGTNSVSFNVKPGLYIVSVNGTARKINAF